MENELNIAYDSPSAVANYFIDAANKAGTPLTTMKLVKLLYIAYGWVIATKNISLFKEDIEAWRYGPVVPSIYHEFKHFGSSPIKDTYSQEYDPFIDEKARTPRVSEKETPEIAEILNIVWDVYGSKSASTLMRMTHKKDTPWDKVYNQQKETYGGVIPPQSIKDYYQGVIEELVTDAA